MRNVHAVSLDNSEGRWEEVWGAEEEVSLGRLGHGLLRWLGESRHAVAQKGTRGRGLDPTSLCHKEFSKPP